MSGPLFEKFFGSELLFFGVGVGRVFFVLFSYVFALLFGFSLPKMSRKNSLDVRSCVSGLEKNPAAKSSLFVSLAFLEFSFS